MRRDTLRRITGCSLAALFAMQAALSLPAAEYELLGSLRGETTYHYLEDAAQPHRLTAAAELTGTHRLSAQQAELKAITTVIAGSEDELDYEIPEAYVTLFPLAPVNLTAGKITASWGTSSRFNPADSLHRFDGAEREGFIGVQSSFSPSADVTVSGVLSVDETLRRPAEDIGTTLTGALFGNLYFGNVEIAPSIVYRYEETLRPAVAASVQLFGFIFYGQGAVELQNGRSYPDRQAGALELETGELGKPYPLLSAGVNRIVGVGPADLSATAEYLYAATGYSQTESELLYDAIEAAVDAGSAPASVTSGFSQPRFWGRHYLYQSLSLTVSRVGSLETTALVNVADWSASFEHTLTVTALDSLDIDFGARWYAGMQGESEYGTVPVRTELPGRLELELGSTFYY